ncbi:MAG: recombinase family protein [Oscillospiraceae bacterium]|nr:recombinase family protein [Oscillospiraceae bacterium]
MELGEKVVRGMTENALKNKYNGGNIPMGYIIDPEQHFQIDPIAAPVMMEIFTLYANGSSVKEIIDKLTKRGIRSIRGGAITYNIINTILKNRRYIGELRYRDIVKLDGVPPIISKKLFDRVQGLLAKNKKAPALYSFLLPNQKVINFSLLQIFPLHCNPFQLISHLPHSAAIGRLNHGAKVFGFDRRVDFA